MREEEEEKWTNWKRDSRIYERTELLCMYSIAVHIMHNHEFSGRFDKGNERFVGFTFTALVDFSPSL